jgi:pimeloyl-ACP methyl ester carboxylesterase
MRTLKPFLRAQSEGYHELAVPVTILVSEADLVVSPTLHSPALQAAAPRSTVIRLPDAGHQVLYTHPRRVIEAIDAALAEERGR